MIKGVRLVDLISMISFFLSLIFFLLSLLRRFSLSTSLLATAKNKTFGNELRDESGMIPNFCFGWGFTDFGPFFLRLFSFTLSAWRKTKAAQRYFIFLTPVASCRLELYPILSGPELSLRASEKQNESSSVSALHYRNWNQAQVLPLVCQKWCGCMIVYQPVLSTEKRLSFATPDKNTIDHW